MSCDTHAINCRPVAGKPWLLEYSANDGPWFRASDLYDAARKLQAQGITGPANSYAANGTLSFVGTIEHWATLAVVERDRSGLRIEPYSARVFK